MSEKLGEILLSVGAISPAALNRALLTQRSTGGRLGTLLLEQGLVTEDTLARALSKATGREYAYPALLQNVPREILALVPPKVAIRCQAIPFARDGRVLKVAMRDPNDLAAADELSFVAGRKIEPYVVGELRMAEALERFYGERRSARHRAILDRLSRAQLAATQPAPAAPVPPPPPPSPYRPAGMTPAAGTASPVVPSPEIWRSAPTAGAEAEEIDIQTWRPPDRSQEPLLTPVAYIPTEVPTPTAVEIEPPPAPVEVPPKPAVPISFQEARERMLAAETRDDIADAVLDHLQGDYAQIALFIGRKEDVIGWNARGEGIARAAFKSVRIPYSQPSMFLNSKLSGGYYQGAPPALPAHQALIESLGGRPGECALLPVAIKKRVVAFLFLVPQGATVPPEKVNDLRALAEVMGDAFARLALKMRRGRETA